MRRAAARCLLAAVVAAGCARTSGAGRDGDSDGGGTTDGPRAPTGTPCERFAAALCARASECGPPAPGLLVYVQGRNFADEATCAARFAFACEQWLGDPCGALPVEKLGDCEELTCTEALQLVTFGHRPTCLLLAGTAGLGEGDACDPAGAACTPGLSCLDGRCARGGDEGAACDPAPCDTLTGHVCAVGRCARGALAPAGERCSGGLGGEPVGCLPGAECVNQNDRGDGTCVAYAADGDACEPWVGPPCLFPAVCLDGRCRIPPSDGCSP